MAVKPFPDLMAGLGSAETAQFFVILEENHSGKTTHPIAAGQTHVLPIVHLNLGESNSTSMLVDDAFQMRRQGETGPAPIGPKIHQHRLLSGGVEHLGLKAVDIDIENGGGVLSCLRHIDRPIC